MLTKDFLCKREVLGKRSPHSFTPPSKCGRRVQHQSDNRVRKYHLRVWAFLSVGEDFLFMFEALKKSHKNAKMITN
jgi:hypothetical protein